MQHQLGILHDRAATIADGAAMRASMPAISCWPATPGAGIDLHIRLFTEEK